MQLKSESERKQEIRIMKAHQEAGNEPADTDIIWISDYTYRTIPGDYSDYMSLWIDLAAEGYFDADDFRYAFENYDSDDPESVFEEIIKGDFNVERNS